MVWLGLKFSTGTSKMVCIQTDGMAKLQHNRREAADWGSDRRRVRVSPTRLFWSCTRFLYQFNRSLLYHQYRPYWHSYSHSRLWLVTWLLLLIVCLAILTANSMINSTAIKEQQCACSVVSYGFICARLLKWCGCQIVQESGFKKGRTKLPMAFSVCQLKILDEDF